MQRAPRILAIGALIAAFLSPINAQWAQAAECTTSTTASGGYTYIAFKNTGTCTWTKPIDADAIDYLVVAGGGSGGTRHAGGGGAGGLLKSENVSLSGIASLQVVVGAGGDGVTPGPSNYAVGKVGGNSALSKFSGVGSFATVTSIGGGGGAGGGEAAQYGGSGGGSQSTTKSSYVAGQGREGGAGGYVAGTYYAAGGGGGAGNAGGDSSSTFGGYGGPGVIWLSAFTPALATSLGLAQTNQVLSNQVYFAGGGGGSTTSGTAGAGGRGGGGDAVVGNSTATSGTANSGGGGGGSGCCNGGLSGAGGTGVVIIRYLNDITPASFTSSSAFSVQEKVSTTFDVATITVNESSTLTINSGVDNLDFTIVTTDSRTARIRFAIEPNFEAPADSGGNNIYNITIRATERMGLTTDQAVSITVTNVNEAPTITAAGGAATYASNQTENLANLYNLNATDVDSGATLTYSLTGTDADDFSISSTGFLSFTPTPDFEDARDSNRDNIYVVITWVSDGTLSDSQTATITVTNANESSTLGAPTISGTAYKGIAISLTVTVNTPGKARFFMDGKRISNCLSVSTTGTYPNFTATCNWKPAVTSRRILSATFTPTDNTFSATNSENTVLWVLKRTSLR